MYYYIDIESWRGRILIFWPSTNSWHYMSHNKRKAPADHLPFWYDNMDGQSWVVEQRHATMWSKSHLLIHSCHKPNDGWLFDDKKRGRVVDSVLLTLHSHLLTFLMQLDLKLHQLVWAAARSRQSNRIMSLLAPTENHCL